MWSASLGESRAALSESLQRVRQMLRRWPGCQIMWFKDFLSSILGCWFWLGPLWQDGHRDTNSKRGCWRPPYWSCWCHRSGLRDDHLVSSPLCTLQYLLFCFSRQTSGSSSRTPRPSGSPTLRRKFPRGRNLRQVRRAGSSKIRRCRWSVCQVSSDGGTWDWSHFWLICVHCTFGNVSPKFYRSGFAKRSRQRRWWRVDGLERAGGCQ